MDDDDLYAAFEAAFAAYKKASDVPPPIRMREHVGEVRSAATKESYAKHEIKGQPEFIRGGDLMPHQLDGLK